MSHSCSSTSPFSTFTPTKPTKIYKNQFYHEMILQMFILMFHILPQISHLFGPLFPFRGSSPAPGGSLRHLPAAHRRGTGAPGGGEAALQRPGGGAPGGSGRRGSAMGFVGKWMEVFLRSMGGYHGGSQMGSPKSKKKAILHFGGMVPYKINNIQRALGCFFCAEISM